MPKQARSAIVFWDNAYFWSDDRSTRHGPFTSETALDDAITDCKAAGCTIVAVNQTRGTMPAWSPPVAKEKRAMTDKAELERVRLIHKWLDHLASREPSDSSGNCYIIEPNGGATHTYTADEIRAWPEMKRQMRAQFEKYPSSLFASLGRHNKVNSWSVPVANAACVADGAIARGLVMYREMIENSDSAATTGVESPAEAQSSVAPEDTGQPKPHGCMDCGAAVCVGDEIRCVYCAHRDDQMIEGGTTPLDERIAAARVELGRKAKPQRFPHPGRNFALRKREEQ